jgi:hypothetical protein
MSERGRVRRRYEILATEIKGGTGITITADVRTYSKKEALGIFLRHVHNVRIRLVAPREPKAIPDFGWLKTADGKATLRAIERRKKSQKESIELFGEVLRMPQSENRWLPIPINMPGIGEDR